MAYIGREPTNSGQFLLIDDISSQFNGSKQSFTLQVGGNDITPAKENIIVAIDGELQEATSACVRRFFLWGVDWRVTIYS